MPDRINDSPAPRFVDRATSSARPTCLDCGAPLYGRCCSECGQLVRDPNPTLRELFADAWDAFASVDGRVLATLRQLLLRPGRLTAEYLSGRRTRYVAPLRLYLTCSAAFFIFYAAMPTTAAGRLRAERKAIADSLQAETQRLTPSAQLLRDSARRRILTRERIPAGTANGPLDSLSRIRADSIAGVAGLRHLRLMPLWLARRISGTLSRSSGRSRKMPAMQTVMPRIMFGFVPVFAVLLAMVYRSRRRRFPVHLVAALYLHAFAFILVALSHAVSLVVPDRMSTPAEIPVLLWLVGAIPFAMQAVYGGRRSMAMLRAISVLVTYLALMFATVLAYMLVRTFL